jgi:predicted permease
MALILGAVLGLLGVRQYLPDFLTDTIANLSACMGPLAMILTGFIIGNYDLKALLKNKKVYLASVLRLIVIPALVIGIFYLLGANKQVLVMSLFAFGTPLGLNTVIIPTSYGSDAHTGASMTMISHVACILTIPLMYAILLAIL